MSFLSIDRDLARDSYYAATAQRGQGFPALSASVDCDVAVVGGGLAGLSAALELAHKGFEVVLLEAKEVAWGASGRNGGQAIHGLACDQETIEAQLGLDDARKVWGMSLEAIDLIRERMATHGIDCDWREGYLGLATSEHKAAELSAWVDRMAEVYGAKFSRIGRGDVQRWIDSPRYAGGMHDPHSGHLHPLKYSLGIAGAAARAGVHIHENTPVTAVHQGGTVRVATASGEVRAKQALLAGNVYLQGMVPQLETRIMPVGTYIVCSESIDKAVCDSLVPSRSAVCDTNFVLDYFRPTNDNRMLYGGRVSYSTRTPRNLAEGMRQRMVGTFPQLASTRIEFAWGGFVDITMNRAPDFGRLAPNLYYLQGFSGHGLALTGLAGKLVAEAMNGDASRFDVFARLKHHAFPGGRWLRTPALVLGMAWYRLRDLLG
ncbi:MAG TPA: FAD-binding oxidoreductase [Ideonella sp.]|nr:FAD-binding oxidoreductase [Ideonella sp.]